MAFLEGSDTSGELSVTVFPALYRQIRGKIGLNKVIYLEGKVERSTFNGELQVLAQRIEPAEEVEQTIADETCYLRIPSQMDETLILGQLFKQIKQHPGNVPVILFFEKDRRKQLLDEKNWLAHTAELETQLTQIFGSENVVFK